MKGALSKQQWIIMEALWDKSPLFLSQIADAIQSQVHVTHPTLLAHLKRLTADGYVAYTTERGSRMYSPLRTQEECMIQESRSLLDRMTASSRQLFMTNMIRESDMTQEECQELRDLIDELAERKGGKDAMKEVLTLLLESTIYSGIIWAAVMLFRKAVRGRAPASVFVALWLIFLARVIVPGTWESNLHFFELSAPAPATREAPADTVATASSVLTENAKRLTTTPRDGADLAEHTDEPETVAASAPNRITWPDILGLIWIGGAAVGIAAAGHSYFRLRKEIQTYAVPALPYMNRLFRDCCEQLHVRRRATLVLHRGGAGLMFPGVVALPESLISSAPAKVRMVLCHELTHLKRGDDIASVLLCLLRALLWFNPFIWLAVPRIREDMETACDQRVVRNFDTKQRAAYAHTMLDMANCARKAEPLLGMAARGSQKDIQDRICGIFHTSGCRLWVKAASIALAGLLVICCFTTACQPAISSEPDPSYSRISSEREGAAESAKAGAASENKATSAAPEHTQSLSSEITQYLPAVYKASGHWQAEIQKENVKVYADVDIMTPDVSAYPTVKLRAEDLTQERVDTLINHFIGVGAEFYELPLEPVKAAYAQEIDSLRAELDANPDDAARIQKHLDAVLTKWSSAPEEVPLNPTTADFASHRDSEPRESLTGKQSGYIEVACRIGDHWGRVVATRNESDPLSSVMPLYANMFKFAEILFDGGETDLREQLADLDASLAYSAGLETAGVDAEVAQLQDALALIEGSPLDLETAEQQAAELLADLAIEDVQITKCEKAVFAPLLLENLEGVDTSASATKQVGAYVEFSRECGGIPLIAQETQLWYTLQEPTDIYCSPLMPERGTIVLDAQGNPVEFTWYAMETTDQLLADANEVPPFTQWQDAFAEWADWSFSEAFPMTLHIETVQLVMGVTDAADDATAAVAVPAWHIVATVDDGQSFTASNEYMLNALDGKPILRPGP